MPRNTSKKAVQLERESRVWQFRCHGWTQERIAGELKIDQGTVSRIEKKCWERMRLALDFELLMHRAIALGQIEHLYDEVVQAWERSKLPRKRSSERTAVDGGGAGGAGDAATVRTTEAVAQTGDPSYIDRAFGAWDRKNKLLGLDAPPKLAIEDESQPGSVSSIAATLEQAEKDFISNHGEGVTNVAESATVGPAVDIHDDGPCDGPGPADAPGDG